MWTTTAPTLVRTPGPFSRRGEPGKARGSGVRACGLAFACLVLGCGRNRASSPGAPRRVLSDSLLVDLGIETANSARDPAWLLTTNDDSASEMTLWSGRAGVHIDPWASGQISIHGLIGTQGEIASAPDPRHYGLSFNGQPLRPLALGASRSLDLRYGLVTTHWFGRSSNGVVEVRQSELLAGSVLYIRIDVRSPAGGTIQFTERSDSRSPIAQSPSQSKPSGGVATFYEEAFVRPEPLSGELMPLDAALKHLKKQRSIQPSISIEGSHQDAAAIHSFIFSLEESATPHPVGVARYSPFALSSDRYRGHVYWDADMWLAPALAFIRPDYLRGLAEFRISHRRKTATGAPYPWESDSRGKECAQFEQTKEIHVSGDVLWGIELAAELGLAETPRSVERAVAAYYLARSTPRSPGARSLLGVISVDEYHKGPDDLYTNLVAQWAVNGATWRRRASAPTFHLPTDSASFLNYEGDKGRSYQQAAALLAVFPLQYPPAEAQARRLLQRFGDKVDPNGPAMSDSVAATIWARLDETKRAYNLWRKSWIEFESGPMMMFHEKRGFGSGYFTTGAAGALQTVIYGFLGFRLDERPVPGAAWQRLLLNGRWLSISPHLPPSWKAATFRHFKVLSRTYTVTVRREGAKTLTSVSEE